MSQLCKYCEQNECPKGEQFCSLEHRYEYEIAQLKQENLSLESRIRLLNCQRTQIWPDLEKTIEGNVLDTVSAFHQYVHEMSPDEIVCLYKKTEALASASLLVITKQNIKSTQNVKAEKKVKQAQDTREDNGAKSPLELAKIKFVRLQKERGFSEAEANKLWSKESVREKAITGFMKPPMNFTRAQAEKMFEQSMKGKEK